MFGLFIHGGMIVEVLAVINGGTFDFIDGRINPLDGFHFVLRLLPVAGAMLQHPPGGAQIGERVQIRWVLGRKRLKLGKTKTQTRAHSQ